MPVVDAYGPRKAMAVRADAWGHLAPKAKTKYQGFVLYAWTSWGDEVLLDADFQGLDCSPWLHECLLDFLRRQVDSAKIKRGTVRRWEGTFEFFPGADAQFPLDQDAQYRMRGRSRRLNLGRVDP